MNIFEAIVLGIVQGVTEFLPVSSSGHLIIARDMLGLVDSMGLTVDAILQLATMLAVIVYFRKRIVEIIKDCFKFVFRRPLEEKRITLIRALIIGTVPAVLGGILLENYMESVFRSAVLVACMFLMGSAIMYFAERRRVDETVHLTVWKGFRVGLFQVLALFPGMSRSGMTISGGLFNKLSREEAVEFSFLLSIPIIAGSGLKKLAELVIKGGNHEPVFSLVVGFTCAFVVGYMSIYFLIKYLKNHTMNLFVWYRVILALFVIGAVLIF